MSRTGRPTLRLLETTGARLPSRSQAEPSRSDAEPSRSEAEPSRSEARAAHPAGRRRPLLYVSGDDEGRLSFIRIARRWGQVTLLVADSGEEGLDIAVHRRPKLVVVDAQLADVDAEHLVRCLRRAMPAGVPILVLGADASPSERARFVWAGASACLTQPLDVGRIDRMVGVLLDQPPFGEGLGPTS